MADHLKLKIKGSEDFIIRFIQLLEESYLVIETSAIKHTPGEEPFIYITVVET